MKAARTQRTRQRGMVVGLLIALLLLGGVLFAFSSLNVASVRVDRDRDTNEVLAQAKDALIAYAVTDLTRPGQLPCPDVNNDGEAKSGEDFNAATGACISLIGRLPWVTLGLPDLRDDTGERLWYAVSADFRTDNTLPPAVPLNSDTAYRGGNASLTLAGMTAMPVSNLAAVVFAPGQTLLRSDGVSQARGCVVGTNCDVNLKCTSAPASATPKCNAQNFLDLDSGVDNADANQSFVSVTRSDSFNDRAMPIYSDDIMRLVERRAARELTQHLRNHYDSWMNTIDVNNSKGFYPYAAPFVDPSAPAQAGSNGTTTGLLPLSAAPLTWSNFPPFVGGKGCWTESGGAVLRCRMPVLCILFICLLDSPISARIENVATRFVDPPGPGNIVFHGLNLGGSPSWTLNAAARRLEFDYGGFLIAAGLLDIEVRAPTNSAWLATSWLTGNNWHQTAGYALSSGYAIDGADTCGGAGPSCLTIANTTAPNNDKQAIVIMAGRALPAAGQSARPVAPPAGIGDFVEGLNADGNVAQFENNARTATFNDTPVAVRP